MDSLSAGIGVQVSGATDRGLVREDNGDATWWRHESSTGSDTVILAVADGMGGPAGEIASSAAINECRRSLIGEITAREAQYRLSAAVRAANARVYNLAQTSEECAGMRASLVVALVLADRLYVAQLGDCRCYVVRSGACVLVTKREPAAPEEVAPPAPGSVEEGVPEGAEPPAEPEVPPAPVVRAAGMAPDVEVDAAGPFELAAGDVVLLCTDGLVVSEEAIAQAATAEPPGRLARTLVSLANSAGGPDNVSVLVARIGAPTPTAAEPAAAPDEPMGEPVPTEDAVAPEPQPETAPEESEPAPELAVAANRAPGRGAGPLVFLGAVLAALAVGFAGGMGTSALMDGGSDEDGGAVAIIGSPSPTEAVAATATPEPAAATRTPAASRSPAPATPTPAATPAIAATTTCADGESPAVELLTSSSLWSVYDIANRYGLAEADLYECDPFLNPYAMYPGVSVVLIPCTSETECPETGEE